MNLMKGGIILADQVTTVSPTYAREIQTREHGAGLDGILRSLSFKLQGILNGIDVEEWDPETDPHLPSHFQPRAAGRQEPVEARAAARVEAAATRRRRRCSAFISRLVDQKGIDLLIAALPHMLAAGAQAVILGIAASRATKTRCSRSRRSIPIRCRVVIGFDNALAHRIYAGADILLMPSIYEPCGLNQMYALRYGTVPVVRLTGGLADTVIPFDGANLDDGERLRLLSRRTPPTSTPPPGSAMLNYREPKTWTAPAGERHGRRLFVGTLGARIRVGLPSRAHRMKTAAYEECFDVHRRHLARRRRRDRSTTSR